MNPNPTTDHRHPITPTINPATTHRRPSRRVRGLRLGGAVLAGALVLAACGGDDSDTVASAGAAAPAVTTAPPAAAANEIAATRGSSSLGEILVGKGGLTLYGFTNDLDARPTCFDACADAWPPVIVGPDWNVGPDLDLGIFATIDRGDGTTQLVAGKWPLYLFAGDAAPGDVNGQGSGDVWFAVDLDGGLIKTDSEDAGGSGSDGDGASAGDDAVAAPVSVAETPLGEVLVDSAGLTVYGFTQDADGVPTCSGACADAWPPVLVASADLPAGLDAEVFSVVDGVDGGFQLKAGKWPLYLFAGDAAPGDVNGQGSGDVWFAVTADGGLVTGDGSGEAAESSGGYGG